jgi:hypothetical protein
MMGVSVERDCELIDLYRLQVEVMSRELSRKDKLIRDLTERLRIVGVAIDLGIQVTLP